MRDYLEGYHFTILTDHQSLKWLDCIENPSGHLARWAMELSQWDYKIQYRRGAENTVADALSRQPLPTCEITATKYDWYKRTLQEVGKNPTNHPEYCIRDGKLHRYVLHTLNFNDTEASEEWKLCIPTEQREKVLAETHSAPSAGHLGIAKTFARLSRFYYWPKMQSDAMKYVRNCNSCQRFKVQQKQPTGTMHATNVTQPWEMVSTDLVDPFPRSKMGNVYLLVSQDCFSKRVELRALRKATAHAICQAIKDICLRHSCPRSIVSDNGRQFISKEFKQLLKELQIEHRCTPTWDKYIQEIAFTYNTAPSESTGFSPAYMNYGRELTPPGSLS